MMDGSVHDQLSLDDGRNGGTFKRMKKDPGYTPKGKSVRVLKGSDVTIQNGIVFMPNTIEMAELVKPGKGQFKTNVQFSSKMTASEVKSLLMDSFPILKDQRFYCAAAADKSRTRLDFHGQPRIWNGQFLRQKIKGNSALYILMYEGEIEAQVAQNSSSSDTGFCEQEMDISSNETNLVKPTNFVGFSETAEPDDSSVPSVGQEHMVLFQAPSTSQNIKCQNNLVNTTISTPDGPLDFSDISLGTFNVGDEDLSQYLNTIQEGSDPIDIIMDESFMNSAGNGNFLTTTTDTFDESKQIGMDLTVDQYQVHVPVVPRSPSAENGISSTEVVQGIHPKSGPMEGGYKCQINLSEPLTSDVTSGTAEFKGVDNDVPWHKLNPYTLVVIVPSSSKAGNVDVAVMDQTGKNLGMTTFHYIDDRRERVKQLVRDTVQELASLFSSLAQEFGSLGGENNAAQGVGPLNVQGQGQTKQQQSLQLLQLLVYTAAETDAQELIKIIFSTSAGQIIFHSYKDKTPLPEDVARANGHSNLAQYLRDVNARLSKEVNSEVQSNVIDWLELVRAAQKQASAQGKSIKQDKCRSESDDNSSDYFGDAETSSGGPSDLDEANQSHSDSDSSIDEVSNDKDDQETSNVRSEDHEIKRQEAPNSSCDTGHQERVDIDCQNRTFIDHEKEFEEVGSHITTGVRLVSCGKAVSEELTLINVRRDLQVLGLDSRKDEDQQLRNESSEITVCLQRARLRQEKLPTQVVLTQDIKKEWIFIVKYVERMREHVEAQLEEKNIITIIGRAGIGKTSLVRKLLAHFKDKNIHKEGSVFKNIELVLLHSRFQDKLIEKQEALDSSSWFDTVHQERVDIICHVLPPFSCHPFCLVEQGYKVVHLGNNALSRDPMTCCKTSFTDKPPELRIISEGCEDVIHIKTTSMNTVRPHHLRCLSRKDVQLRGRMKMNDAFNTFFEQLTHICNYHSGATLMNYLAPENLPSHSYEAMQIGGLREMFPQSSAQETRSTITGRWNDSVDVIPVRKPFLTLNRTPEMSPEQEAIKSSAKLQNELLLQEERFRHDKYLCWEDYIEYLFCGVDYWRMKIAENQSEQEQSQELMKLFVEPCSGFGTS